MAARLNASTWLYTTCLAVVLLLYGLLSFYQIELPGLHYDEAFEAVPAVQLLQGQPVTAFRESGLQLAGNTFPLMTQDYIGALNTYAALPFIAVLGSTPTALRTMSILVGVITLLMTTLLANRLTGQRWVGLTAALLLATDPTFIFWNRQGVFVTAITATIGVSATYCWSRRFETTNLAARKQSIWWGMAGAFLFGLGLYAKFLFLWLIFALIGAVILLNLDWLGKNWRRLDNSLKQTSIFEVIGWGIAFLLGCWPLIVYNVQTGGTFLNISQNASTSYYGVNNLAISSNLATRLGQFGTMLSGQHFWYLGEIFGNVWSLVAFGIVLVLVVMLATRMIVMREYSYASKVALFPFLVIGLVILASIGTVSALWVTHFAILMPWPALALSIGCWYIFDNLPLKFDKVIQVAVWVGLALLVATNFIAVTRYHRALTISGGLSTHSDAIYDLNEWMTQNATGAVVAMDWGLAAPIVYLSNGQVSATEIFGYAWESDTQFTARLQGFIAQPNSFYLWRAPDEIIFDRSDDFKALYRPQNLEENIEEAFYERSGRPLLGVTRLVEKGTAENPPQ